MKQIQIHSFFSTEIYPEFHKIINIDIDDKPFAEGGFGEVYFCLALNGNKLKTPQVIKIFKESFPGSADENLKTIARLQEKFKQLNIELSGQNKSLSKEFPAFIALPQFSFIGYINGQLVKGFSSNNLSKLGYYEFEKILSDTKLYDKFYNIPVQRRIYFAYQLASAFKVLDDFKYIHADLKLGAIFLNLDSQELAIIDYDSGVITENADDEPKTWGAIGDWVAPEIFEQLGKVKKGEKINVDIFTDRWSVTIGVNYLISGLHPLFYLTELGPAVTKNYFESKQWPDANINDAYFCKENEQVYKQYLNFINTKIPSQIKEKMSYTINFGYKTPAARTSYKDWQAVLKSIQLPPVIKFLSISKNEIIEGESITIAWNSENAISVEIDNVSGVLGAIDKKIIKPKSTASFKIKFKGYYGEVSETIDIKVIPAPKFKVLKSDNHKIKKGDSTSLVWEIENSINAKLSGVEMNPVSISHYGNQIIKPDTTTTYKFEVTALDGKTNFEKFITVEVFEEGKITFFKADRQFVFPTIPVTLSWEVQNALKVEIEGIGDFQLSGQTIVQPTIDTTYKLIVTDNFDTITVKLQVKMLPLPVIEKLIINTPILHSHSNINITVADFSSNCFSLPSSVGLKKSTYNCKIDTTFYNNIPKVKEINFRTVNIPLMKRIKRVLSLIKKEFTNEKNKKYVTKK